MGSHGISKTIFVMIIAIGISAAAGNSSSVLEIGLNPQLFMDDYVVDRMEGLARKVHSPVKLSRPVLDNQQFGTNQPFLSVLFDKVTNRFRLWYNRAPGVWYTESEDGVRWGKPVKLNVPCTFCCSVLDTQGFETNPARRYKFIGYDNSKGRSPGDYVAFSPDGKTWTVPAGNPVLPAYSGDAKQWKPNEVDDIVDAFYDPLHHHYAAAVKVWALAGDHLAPGPRAGSGYRRLVGLSVSDDFLHWTDPRRIFVPDAKDEGLIEFYGMGGVHARGSLLIGFLRVLRDDLPCDKGGPANGIGYTVLASSRDGITWQRFREPFLDRDPKPGRWDHAMTWISAAVPVGDEVYFYYGGYARGHKIQMSRDRQIGLAKLRKDGYVSLSAGTETGFLLTHPIIFAGKQLFLNIDSSQGEARVEIQQPDGKPIAGYALDQCERISSNSIGHIVKWQDRTDLSTLAGKPVCLKVVLRKTDLYAFKFQGD